MFKFTKITTEHTSTVCAFLNGELLTADETHPNYKLIVKALEQEGQLTEADIAELFDVKKTVEKKTANLSVHVTLKDDDVYFDGLLATGPLATKIAELFDEGVEDWKPLVAFADNIAGNESEHSKQQLYRWLNTAHFTITEDGYIVGYKGVTKEFTSRSAPASDFVCVNDKPFVGPVDNAPGNVVTMPRHLVNFDPTNGCSRGLHVGTWEFARDFGEVVVEVKVNPRDVVSIPTDSHDQKMRVCRYEVIKVVDRAYPESVKFNDNRYENEDPEEDLDFDDDFDDEDF